MLGHPKFKYGDKVKFKITTKDNIEKELEGEIFIVDAYGTFNQSRDVSYDIMVEHSHFDGGPCLYKHIVETEAYQ